MSKYRNKYRIESARRPAWDYRSKGAYFITICTHNRMHHFGTCDEGGLKLSAMGLLVQGCWFEISRRNHQVTLGEFIVMPNHIHGILILDDQLTENENRDIRDNVQPINPNTDDFLPNTDVQTLNFNVSTPSEFYQSISPKSGSVSRIIQQFKRACTYHIKCTFPEAQFKWQERFHDHIIRNEQSFIRISNYIVNNPLKWAEDKFYQKEN